MLSEDMDEQLFVLAVGVVDVHLSHFSEPSENISVHDYESAKKHCLGALVFISTREISLIGYATSGE